MEDAGTPSPAEFVAARGDALLRLAWLLTADGAAAEDLVQEALARALPRWGRIRPGGHESYLRTAIRSAWIDSWRRRSVRVALDVVPPSDLPDDGEHDRGVETVALRLSVREALGRLTARQRAVLVLRFYEDLSEADTARAMNVSVGTVKSQTRHALDRLRALAPELAHELAEVNR